MNGNEGGNENDTQLNNKSHTYESLFMSFSLLEISTEFTHQDTCFKYKSVDFAPPLKWTFLTKKLPFILKLCSSISIMINEQVFGALIHFICIIN